MAVWLFEHRVVVAPTKVDGVVGGNCLDDYPRSESKCVSLCLWGVVGLLCNEMVSHRSSWW